MDKKKIELILAAGLVAVFAVIIIANIAGMGKKKPAVYREEAAAVSVFDERKDIPGKSAQGKSMQWGRDPFVMYESSAGPVSGVGNLKIMGITSGADKKPMAVINNEIVRVGSRIGKFSVLKISHNSVTVTDGAEVSELKIDK